VTDAITALYSSTSEGEPRGEPDHSKEEGAIGMNPSEMSFDRFLTRKEMTC
jgi:hypothetical protein